MKGSKLRRAIPDLARLPIAFDISALSLAEGLRAGLSIAVLIALSAWLGRPELIEAAVAALFTCLCDVGGPLRRRLPALASFGVIGAGLVMLGGLARHAGIAVALPYGVLVIFCCSFARVYGPQPQQVGMFLSVVLVLSIDHDIADFRVAGELGLLFVLGALWATLLTLVLWRLYPFRPVRKALARAYESLAAMTRDLQALAQNESVDLAAWEFHARAQRRSVRTVIEAARVTILDVVRTRGPMTQRGTQSLLRLEIADQLFGALIAMSERLETADLEERRAAAHMTRRLRPLLVVLAHEMLLDRHDADGQIGRSIDAMSRDIAVLPEGNRLRELAGLIIARLRVALTVSRSVDTPVDAGPGARPVRMWQALRTPVLANLDRDSIALRHALRAAFTTAPALAFTLIHHGPFDHWVSITILVTMQPYFGNTFARALERAGGTTLGGLFAAALGLVITTPLAVAGAVIPLAVLVFPLRAVSFGLFVSGLTPIIVLLVEAGEPGTSELLIAGQRVLLTIAGGLSAVAGCWLLWPSWEPSRLPAEVRAAIAAHAAYIEAELALILGEIPPAGVDQARRAAGLATNNVEASVARALLEPRSAQNERLEAAMVIDAALRRMAGRLAAMQFDPAQAAALPRESWLEWRAWLRGAMSGLLTGRTTLTPAPTLVEGIHTEALGRIARQVALIAGTIERVNT